MNWVRITIGSVAALVVAIALAIALMLGAIVFTVPMMAGQADQGREQVKSVPGLPQQLLEAYQKAAGRAPKPCRGMRWQVLAGVAQIESNQAAGSTIDEHGNVAPPIVGPALDGSGAGGNTTAIADTDQGRWDGDEQWDRAVGVLQFIPTSWTAYTSGSYDGDGNGDGTADPHNVFDNAQAAMNHLCSAGGAFDSESATNEALYRYNQSTTYVAMVARAIARFDATPVSNAGSPSGEFNGTCDVDADLPRPNPRSCAEAVEYALEMVHQDCVWLRMCLAATAVEYGWSVSGVYSAIDMWHLLDGRGYGHPENREPPVGALLFWDGGTWGHVAIHVGGGKIVSNDLVRSGCMDIADWDAPETLWGQTYLGWTPPYYPNGAGRA